MGRAGTAAVGLLLDPGGGGVVGDRGCVGRLLRTPDPRGSTTNGVVTPLGDAAASLMTVGFVGELRVSAEQRG